MKTLYISDMDGTLLNDGGKVSRRSVEIINELIKNGMLFTVATARSAMSAAELLKDIDISVPAVLMNGVFLFDLKNKKAVTYHEIPKDAFFAITEIFVRRNKSPFVFFYGDDGKFTIEYTDFKLPIHRDFYEKRKGKFFGEFKKVSEYEILDDMHPVFISLSDGYDELKPIYDAAQKINGVTCSFTPTHTPHTGFSKYTAVRRARLTAHRRLWLWSARTKSRRSATTETIYFCFRWRTENTPSKMLSRSFGRLPMKS